MQDSLTELKLLNYSFNLSNKIDYTEEIVSWGTRFRNALEKAGAKKTSELTEKANEGLVFLKNKRNELYQK